MKIIRFLFSLGITSTLLWALSTSFNVKGAALPPLGKFLSPFTGFWQNGEALSAQPSDLKLEGLRGTAQIVFDDRQIPHVFAENLNDAYFVQGYLHAKNRLWEMDFLSRASGGRMAETVGNREIRPGFTALDLDRQLRRKGIVWGAEKTAKEWEKDAETFALIKSYCDGANAHIAQISEKNYPVEYKFFGLTPELWTPLKMAIVAKYMALDLASYESDLLATNAKILFGSDFDFIFPEYFKEQSPIVPSGTSWNAPSASLSDAQPVSMGDLSMLPVSNDPNTMPDPSNGSNNWAVSGSKTKNKKPILCGDPHLSLRLPSIWYEMQISTPNMSVYGVSIPGAPAIIIGFNENIAWSPTNVGHDVADWYSIRWKDATKTAYLLDGNYKNVEYRVEDIKVKGLPAFKDTVRYTVWGPVVFENDTMPQANMAYRWLANEVPETSFMGFIKLNQAKNYAEYAQALEAFNVPAQNFAFACKDGDIALKVQGLFPKKAKGQGRFLLDGSNSKSGWSGYMPKAQNPQYRNPKRGFISSANQHSTDPTYPNYYNTETFEAYRGRIVNQMLTKSDTFSVEDMMAMQNSNYSLMAEEALPQMLKNLDTSALDATALGVLTDLKNWDYNYTANSKTAIYFEEWFNSFYDETWDEVLKHSNKKNILSPTRWRTIFILRDEPKNKFFDVAATAERKETASDLLSSTFRKMLVKILALEAEMKAKFPDNPVLSWGNYQDSEVSHISSLPGFGRQHLNLNGYGKALNAQKKNHGPSWKMIVELGDTPRAFVVYPGGQSGNVGSAQYDTFLDTWRAGKYYEALFLKKADQTDSRITGVQHLNKK
jgi:penicillin G amidase